MFFYLVLLRYTQTLDFGSLKMTQIISSSLYSHWDAIVRETLEVLCQKLGIICPSFKASYTDNKVFIAFEIQTYDPTQHDSLITHFKQELGNTEGFKDREIFITLTNETLDRPTPLKIAIASGKGGVGKSTIALALGLGLQDLGFRVGILDADLYGPSIPHMFDYDQKPLTNENGQIIPAEKEGLHFISMGLFLDKTTPIIWRGPILQKTIKQFLTQVAWPLLDFILIDLPPGTGDIQLSLIQQSAISQAVIVSTPQDIALLDARRAIEMFKKLEVPLCGIVENMSYYICPNCDHEDHIFSHGGAKKLAAEYKIPYLGEIPLNSKIQRACDTSDMRVLTEKPSFKSMAHAFIKAMPPAFQRPLSDDKTKSAREAAA